MEKLKKYGIYNTCTKKFVFGIVADNPYKAKKLLFKKIGNDARKWRFEARLIPEHMLDDKGKLPYDGPKGRYYGRKKN